MICYAYLPSLSSCGGYGVEGSLLGHLGNKGEVSLSDSEKKELSFASLTRS